MSGAIQTFSGILFDPLDPDPAAIDVVDVAHALANHCRFGGHALTYFSVAQHSCLVADAVEATGAGAEATLWALLHDGTEAYLVDLPHPLKHRSALGGPFRAAEAVLQAAMCERFELPLEPPPVVKRVDRSALAAERRALMAPTADAAWPELDGFEPLAVEIDPWPPERAKAEFLARYERLEQRRRLVRAWADAVDDVEGGYAQPVGEYVFALSQRDRLENGRARADDELRALDERFRAATVPDEGRRLGAYSTIEADAAWWWRRLPRSLAEELR